MDGSQRHALGVLRRRGLSCGDEVPGRKGRAPTGRRGTQENVNEADDDVLLQALHVLTKKCDDQALTEEVVQRCVQVVVGNAANATLRMQAVRVIAAHGGCEDAQFAIVLEALAENELKKSVFDLVHCVNGQPARAQSLLSACLELDQLDTFWGVAEQLLQGDGDLNGIALAATLVRSGIVELFEARTDLGTHGGVMQLLCCNLGLLLPPLPGQERTTWSKLPHALGLDGTSTEQLIKACSQKSLCVDQMELLLAMLSLKLQLRHGVVEEPASSFDELLLKLTSLSPANALDSSVNTCPDVQQEPRWVWSLLCFVRELTLHFCGSRRRLDDLLLSVPAQPSLPLHVQSWTRVAQMLPIRTERDVGHFLQHLCNKSTWFQGTKPQIKLLYLAAKKTGWFALMGVLELQHPSVMLAKREDMDELLAVESLDYSDVFSSVGRLGLAAIMARKYKWRLGHVKMNFQLSSSSWEIRAAELNLAAVLGPMEATLSWNKVARAILSTEHPAERHAAMVCALQCRPFDRVLHYAWLTADPDSFQVLLQQQQELQEQEQDMPSGPPSASPSSAWASFVQRFRASKEAQALPPVASPYELHAEHHCLILLPHLPPAEGAWADGDINSLGPRTGPGRVVAALLPQVPTGVVYWLGVLGALALQVLNVNSQLRSQPYCTDITNRCGCDGNPVTLLLIMDVSRSIDREDLFRNYVRALNRIHCGLNLGLNQLEPGKDALGLITFGWATKVSVPLKRYSEEAWRSRVDQYNSGSFKTRNWARTCCTPLADAFDMAHKEIKAAMDQGRIEPTSDIFVHVLTDGFPVQNRLRRARNQKYKFFTQEKMFPSGYKLQKVPEKANVLKNKWGAEINVFLMPNRKGLDVQDSIDYFKGVGLVPESSQKRKAFTNAREVFKPRVMTHSPEGFPIVSTPVNNHVANYANGATWDEIVDGQISLVCQGNLIPANGDCLTTPEPTTASPTPNPTTPVPTPPPTRDVATCRGDKDLIFVVDSSSSISTTVSGKRRRFREFILTLAQDLQRIQSEGQPLQRTALITFGPHVKVRIPLQTWSYLDWADEIEKVREIAEVIVGCCTPTAEAFRAAKDLLETRSDNSNPAIVFVITDGVPMINKDNYELDTKESNSGLSHPSLTITGTTQYRRSDGKNKPSPNTPEPEFATEIDLPEYRSSVVFREAEALKAVPNTEVYLVGVRNKNGQATKVEYFLGLENEVTSCRANFQNTPLECTNCAKNFNPCTGNDPNGICWVTGAKAKDCSTGFYGSLVDGAESVNTDDLDTLVESLRTLICGAGFIPN
ncbi:Cartilage matrix protein [Durusdinium trenchii]|uniref:Cartilage matrix protein n=1 Tax=Durusdinium trenchii TaxID=1381693 RepID=A0ABP0JG76_9DINO